ncbi:hypothetical protein LY76DRAFT_292354 [Colletotrichum caudatum]|nr:hypothetical protein LY76DRAFT_292354 [Colletotrichum caudatum]
MIRKPPLKDGPLERMSLYQNVHMVASARVETPVTASLPTLLCFVLFWTMHLQSGTLEPVPPPLPSPPHTSPLPRLRQWSVVIPSLSASLASLAGFLLLFFASSGDYGADGEVRHCLDERRGSSSSPASPGGHRGRRLLGPF